MSYVFAISHVVFHKIQSSARADGSYRKVLGLRSAFW
jgi:hypothetical protein